MTTSTLSSVAIDAIDSCGHAAQNVIAAYSGGNKRLVDGATTRWQSMVERRGARLSDRLQGDLVAAGNEAIGYYATGYKRLSDSAAVIVNTATRLASGVLGAVATSAANLEAVLDVRLLPRVAPIAMPTARASLDLANTLLKQSGKLSARVNPADVEVAAVRTENRKVTSRKAA